MSYEVTKEEFEEYKKMSIPQSICCPNAELPYKISSIVKDTKTEIIINCAGRTRSIIGAQTLINFGIKNRVYALENGTQGWFLSDLKLDNNKNNYFNINPNEFEKEKLKNKIYGFLCITLYFACIFLMLVYFVIYFVIENIIGRIKCLIK